FLGDAGHTGSSTRLRKKNDNIVLLGGTLGFHKNAVPKRLQQTVVRMWEQLKRGAKNDLSLCALGELTSEHGNRDMQP
ncbi:hypothetical protein LEMLEM_LOCUS21290, partial [Lemmus lemmus]